jgi:4'-phosphopantetheinyl transferase
MNPGEVLVHVLAVGDERPEDRALLSAEERDRADRFRFAKDRALYTAAHAGLRRALARELAARPEELAFATEAGGRPRLLGGADLCFSLSHSGDRALVALARTPRLGVDVEVFRPGVDRARLAARNFTPAEQAELRALDGQHLEHAFYRIWTRKEAYVKALGRGLYHPLDAFDVSAGAEARFVAFRDGSKAEAWSLFDLELGAGRAGALAIELPAARLLWNEGTGNPGPSS